MDFSDWPIEDLFAVPSEDDTDEDGVPVHCVYSRSIDSVTFVGPEDFAQLKARGIGHLAELPE